MARTAARIGLILASLAASLFAVLVVAGGIGTGADASAGSGARLGTNAKAATPGRRPAPGGGSHVTVTNAAGRTIPAGFVGLSMETDGLTTPGGPIAPFDPVLAQLIRNLSPGARPVLRIGGDSSDYSWWPIAGMRPPAGVHYALTPAWVAEVRALAQATNASLILGINLQSGSRLVATTEARQLVAGIGAQWIQALELGNEPELYRTLPALIRSGTRDNTGQRVAAFSRLYSGVVDRLPGGALAGPSIGSDKWLPYLRGFLRREPRVRLVTVHRYPLKHCLRSMTNTVSALLSDAASRGLADSVRASVRVAHSRGLPLRVDEMNSVTCGGEAGVSNTFASALWALNTMFEMARAGVDGVNFHTRPLSLGQLFDLSHTGSTWHAAIRPEYYGLLTFALAAPAGSRLLTVGQPATPGLHTWATRTASGDVHAVLINESTRRQTLAVRLPVRGTVTSLSLRAAGLGATAGITLGGQSFAPGSTTGLLAGAARPGTVAASKGTFHITLPAASAVLLSGHA